MRRLILAATVVALVLATGSPASAHYQPLPGEGLRAMTARVCGSDASWREQAARNGLTGNMWLYLGRAYDIECATKAAPTVAPPASVPSWATPVVGACRPPTGGGQYLAPRSGYRHQGIDLGGIEGMRAGTPVRAIGAGTVVYVGWSGNAGGQVQIDHGNGVRSKTNHLSSFAVSYGQRVAAGQTIGGMGATGNATGVHAHVEVWLWGSHVDPVAFMAARGVRLGC